MDETANLKITFARTGSSPLPVWFEVRVDEQVFFAEELTECKTHTVEINLPDSESVHNVQFTLAGKTYEHTKLNENNEIIEDALVNIEQILLADIDITFFAESTSVYRHWCNKPNPTDADYVELQSMCMGCNGDIKFQFETPAFIWLLENL